MARYWHTTETPPAVAAAMAAIAQNMAYEQQQRRVPVKTLAGKAHISAPTARRILATCESSLDYVVRIAIQLGLLEAFLRGLAVEPPAPRELFDAVPLWQDQCKAALAPETEGGTWVRPRTSHVLEAYKAAAARERAIKEAARPPLFERLVARCDQVSEELAAAAAALAAPGAFMSELYEGYELEFLTLTAQLEQLLDALGVLVPAGCAAPAASRAATAALAALDLAHAEKRRELESVATQEVSHEDETAPRVSAEDEADPQVFLGRLFGHPALQEEHVPGEDEPASHEGLEYRLLVHKDPPKLPVPLWHAMEKKRYYQRLLKKRPQANTSTNKDS